MTAFSGPRLAALRAEVTRLRRQVATDPPNHEVATGTLASMNAILDELEGIGKRQLFYEDIIGTSPTVVFRGNPRSQKITYVSPNIERVTGFRPATFLNVFGFWAQHIHPEDAASVAEAGADAMARESATAVYEYRFLCQNGRYHWFAEQRFFVYDDGGNAVEFTGYAHDITERKEIELALQAGEAQLAFQAAIIDRVNDAIIEIDPDYRIMHWNQAAEQIYGWRADEVLGKPLGEVIPVVRYETGQTTAEVAAEMQRTGFWSGEVVQRHRDGHELILDGSARLIRDEHGTILSRVTINRDITERKRLNEIAGILHAASLALTRSLELDEVLDTLLQHLERLVPFDHASVFLLDADGRLRFLAGRGYERRRENHDLAHISFDPHQNQIFQRILAMRESVLVPEMQTDSNWEVRREASDVQCFLGVPLLVADNVLGVFCVDKAEPGFLTPEHVHLAEALAAHAAIAIQHGQLFAQVREGRTRLERMSQQLMQVQEVERRQIARELHDEIGQTMTTLKINMQVLSGRPEEHVWVRLVEDSNTIIDHAINRLRDLSQELRPAILDDLGLVSAVRWYVSRVSERSGIQGSVDVEADVPRLLPEIEITGFRLVQEALTNVVRHARAHHVWVSMRCSARELELAVRDDGEGFDVSEAQARAAGGHGLGLLSMQERVRFMGGELAVSASAGGGTEVRVLLPLVTA